MRRRAFIVALLVASGLVARDVRSAEPPLIRFGHGFAAEEQVWLMAARPDLTPNQGKKYRLKFIAFPGNPERLQAYLAGELDAGTIPGLTAIFSRAQGMDLKVVAGISQEAAGPEWFTTTYLVKDEGPIRSVRDLKGGTIGVVGIKSATDLWARAAVLAAGLTPDRDVKVVPIPFPAMGGAVRTDKVTAGVFVEPFYSAEKAKGGLRPLFTAVEAVGYDHDLLDIWFGEKFLRAQPEVVRAFLADYLAATRYYLSHTAEAKRDLHKAGFVKTPLEIYLKNADWKRDPAARVDVASLKKLAGLMAEKLGWLEKPVDVDELVDLGYLPR
jgi:ABC-type nitrate/sulfonate/bicarbonate transport system substrate-binding protein